MTQFDDKKIAKLQESFQVKYEIHNAEVKYQRSLRRIGIQAILVAFGNRVSQIENYKISEMVFKRHGFIASKFEIRDSKR